MTRMKKDGCHLTLSASRKKNRGNNLARWRQLISAERNTVVEKPISCAMHNEDAEEVPEGSLSVVYENKTEGKFILQGRRVIDGDHFVKQLQELDNHGNSFSCKLSDMEMIGEKKNGLMSTIKFRCLMCGIIKKVTTFEEKTNKMDVNKAAVMGFMTTGGGHSQLEEVMSVIQIPVMSNKSYIKTETELGYHIEKEAKTAMEEAAMEEKRIALEMGDIDVDGIPLVPVAADGSWAKRSYRSNYSSLSGLAAIIGYRTKKVIFLGIRNKYCTVCVRSSGKTPRDHLCFKNWDGSSSAMESSIIADGFRRSEEMYGIRYNKIVADGDSSVYHKLVQERPYKSLPIEKIEWSRLQMTLYHCNQCQSVTSQKWPGNQWESTHSCTTVPHTCSFSHKCHSKHKLRRALSEPGLNISTISLELKTTYRKECQPVSGQSIDDDITIEAITPEDDTSLSVPNLTDLLKSQDLQQGHSSGSEENPEIIWSRSHDKLDESDSLFGADDAVQFDDYYYEDEENKSKIISFKNCSLRLHGLLFLLLIYAAGYLAYTFVLPSSKRKCLRQPPNVTPTNNNTLSGKTVGT